MADISGLSSTQGSPCDLHTSPCLPSVRARLHTRQHTFEEMKVMDLDEFASVAARTGGGNPFVARRLLGQALEEEEEKATKEGMTEDEARAYEIMVSPTWSSRGGPRGEDGIAFVRFVRSFNGIGCQRKLLFQTAVHEQTFDLLDRVAGAEVSSSWMDAHMDLTLTHTACTLVGTVSPSSWRELLGLDDPTTAVPHPLCLEDFVHEHYAHGVSCANPHNVSEQETPNHPFFINSLLDPDLATLALPVCVPDVRDDMEPGHWILVVVHLERTYKRLTDSVRLPYRETPAGPYTPIRHLYVTVYDPESDPESPKVDDERLLRVANNIHALIGAIDLMATRSEALVTDKDVQIVRGGHARGPTSGLYVMAAFDACVAMQQQPLFLELDAYARYRVFGEVVAQVDLSPTFRECLLHTYCARIKDVHSDTTYGALVSNPFESAEETRRNRTLSST